MRQIREKYDLFPVISDVADGVNHVRRAAVFWRAPTRDTRNRNFLIPGNARIPPRVASRVGGSERDIYEGDER